MTSQQLLLSTVNIAKIHEERLIEALESLEGFLPINAEQLASFNRNQRAHLDAMAMRYVKLQDIIGSRIFGLLLEAMAESVASNRFLDVLDHLEKIGILESADFWIDLRNVRNFIAHEYPDEPELLVKNINTLHECSLKLLSFWKKLQQEIKTLLQS